MYLNKWPTDIQRSIFLKPYPSYEPNPKDLLIESFISMMKLLLKNLIQICRIQNIEEAI
ncbi:MAG: hypothetical protein ACOVOR_04310 [Rhabdochlamydiaceae bacterium]